MSGWTHEEAKRHSVVERLLERCATYGGGTCEERKVPTVDWCERCLAAFVLTAKDNALAAVREVAQKRAGRTW